MEWVVCGYFRGTCKKFTIASSGSYCVMAEEGFCSAAAASVLALLLLLLWEKKWKQQRWRFFGVNIIVHLEDSPGSPFREYWEWAQDIGIHLIRCRSHVLEFQLSPGWVCKWLRCLTTDHCLLRRRRICLSLLNSTGAGTTGILNQLEGFFIVGDFYSRISMFFVLLIAF